MFGFRVLAVILALVCLASAAALFFQECPRLAPVSEYFIKNFVRDAGVQAFIKSADPEDVKIKHLVKYTLSGLAICSFGLGSLFFCAAFNPLRMRPFIVVAMICSALMIAAAIWQGIRLGIFKSWWIGDAAGALVVLILLAALFPRERAAVTSGIGEEEEKK